LQSEHSMMPLVWEMKRSKRNDQYTGLAVLILLLLAGWTIQYLVSVQGSQGSAGKNNGIFVGVEGTVNKPGVYCFEREPSLMDLIQKAGGLQDGSDDIDYGSYPTFVQGTMVHISPKHSRVEVSTEALPATYKITLLIPISMNEASREELVAIPEIGPELAQRIIDHRSRYGPFNTVDELTAVPGIGKVRLSKIRPFVKI
jgi:competence protein ComEA